jgi:hypothetical protein
VMPYVDLAENNTKLRGHAMNIADDNDQHLRPSFGQDFKRINVVSWRPISNRGTFSRQKSALCAAGGTLRAAV